MSGRGCCAFADDTSPAGTALLLAHTKLHQAQVLHQRGLDYAWRSASAHGTDAASRGRCGRGARRCRWLLPREACCQPARRDRQPHRRLLEDPWAGRAAQNDVPLQEAAVRQQGLRHRQGEVVCRRQAGLGEGEELAHEPAVRHRRPDRRDSEQLLRSLPRAAARHRRAHVRTAQPPGARRDHGSAQQHHEDCLSLQRDGQDQGGVSGGVRRAHEDAGRQPRQARGLLQGAVHVRAGHPVGRLCALRDARPAHGHV